jgi:hypothetical protein
MEEFGRLSFRIVAAVADAREPPEATGRRRLPHKFFFAQHHLVLSLVLFFGRGERPGVILLARICIELPLFAPESVEKPRKASVSFGDRNCDEA